MQQLQNGVLDVPWLVWCHLHFVVDLRKDLYVHAGDLTLFGNVGEQPYCLPAGAAQLSTYAKCEGKEKLLEQEGLRLF